MLTPHSLPRVDGVPHGRYRLLLGERTEDFFGVSYRGGRSVAPVDGRTLLRQHGAFGDTVKVEPWDIETARAVREHLVRTERDDLLPLLDEWIAANDPDAAPASAEGEKKPEDLTVDELKAKLDELGAEYDKRWGKAKLLEALVAAEKPAEPAEPSVTTPAAPSSETSEPAAPPSADGLDEMTLEQLRERATAAGIEVGNKQERAIIKLLRRATTDAAPANVEGEKA